MTGRFVEAGHATAPDHMPDRAEDTACIQGDVHARPACSLTSCNMSSDPFEPAIWLWGQSDGDRVIRMDGSAMQNHGHHAGLADEPAIGVAVQDGGRSPS